MEQQGADGFGFGRNRLQLVHRHAAPESYLMWRDCGVYCTAQGAGSLTFACEETPTAALNANILILEVAG